jgi:hypothetical protein
MKRKRLAIYPKDVSIILGKSQKQAERILRDIKFALNKDLQQYVTMQEFADYTGIPLEDVRASCI